MVSEILIALKKGKPEEEQSSSYAAPEEESKEEEADEGQLAAAEDLMAAVKSGDAKSVLEAFKALQELCWE
jgi:hypothetical protein